MEIQGMDMQGVICIFRGAGYLLEWRAVGMTFSYFISPRKQTVMLFGDQRLFTVFIYFYNMME